MYTLDEIVDNVRGLSYEEFINFTRGMINTEYTSTSYFKIKDGYSSPMSKKDVMITIYSNYYENIVVKKKEKYPNIEKADKIIIVFRKKDGKEEIYEKEIGQRRTDIYEHGYLRSKIPESAILYNTNDHQLKSKLTEIRPYIKEVEKYMKKQEKILEKSILNVSYLPTILLLPEIFLTEYRKYFPPIHYVSRPYYQDNPYVFKVWYGTTDIFKTPIRVSKNLLSALIVSEIVKYPTLEPYMLNLPYDFEFDRKNLESINLELDFDEAKYKFRKALDKILKAIFDLKLKPADFASYQVVIKEEGPVFIDIGDGFEISLNKSGLQYILAEALSEIFKKMDKFSLLKLCEKRGNKLVCNPDIKNPVSIEEFAEFPKDLYYKISSDGEIDKKSIEELKKYDIIGEYLNLADGLKKDEFDPIKEYSSEVVEAYNRFQLNYI